jgi:hypothetical protein
MLDFNEYGNTVSEIVRSKMMTCLTLNNIRSNKHESIRGTNSLCFVHVPDLMHVNEFCFILRSGG